MIRIKILTLFACMTLQSYLYGQEIKISSCKLCINDSIDVVAQRTDNNGVGCALLKVTARNITGQLHFKGNVIEQTMLNDTTYTIYVTDRTKRLTLYHNDYLPKTIDFTFYEDSPKGLLGNSVYQMLISGNDVSTPLQITNNSGSRMLQFVSNKQLNRVFVDGVEWEISNNSAMRLIPCGSHNYEAVFEGNVSKKGSIELESSIGKKIVHLNFE